MPRHGVYVSDYVENGTAETLLAFMRIYDNNGHMDKKLIISTVRVRIIIESAVIRELAESHSDERLARPLKVLAEIRKKLNGANPPDNKWVGDKLAEEFHALCMASENISIPIMMNPFTSCCAEFSHIWADQIGALNAVDARESIYGYGVLPLPRGVMHVLNTIINLLRSIPFLILMILLFPLTRRIIGTAVGTTASIVPLFIAAFPFVARLVESNLREINPDIIETAQSMGASPLQIIAEVMIPESMPSLIFNATIAVTTILGYTAMSGIIGGGGLGKIAINYGYYRYKYLVMIFAVVILIIMVQLFQNFGTYLSLKRDKRVKH